ncbi:MAG TPA: glycoside hydrolase family 76 protein [Pseudonocardiaceae bacterium]|nr:glycoside hydrolase family 76 protein [Pseudonocardiaceae bacterium]
MNAETLRRLVDHAPIVFDTMDRLTLSVGVAVAVLICAAIAALSQPRHQPRRAHQWLMRAGIILAVLGSIVAVTAAAIPDRPAQAAPTATYNARLATVRALTALVVEYRSPAGVWDSLPGLPGWWQSAVDLDDMIAAERALGTHADDWVIAQTYAVTQDTYAEKIIRWRGPYYDDAGWWGVMWLDAYQWTHDRRYLVAAQGVADWLERGRTGSCGGGVEWGDPSDIRHGDQKNSITNTLTVDLDAGLYQVTHRPADLSRALASWRWLRSSDLVQPGRLVADHLDAACHPVGVDWSYTQGMAIRSGMELTAATGDVGYEATADRVADSATTSRGLNPAGVLREPCAPRQCGVNGVEFPGVLMVALGQLGGHHTYLARQALSAYRHDRMVGDDGTDLYGLDWHGPPDMTSPGRQASAVAVFAAALDG